MLFITGTDTGVGKTHVAAVLLQQLQLLGLNAAAYKPVCSGIEFATPATSTPQNPATGFWSDLRRLQQACSLPARIEEICPQRFLAPLAPDAAARAEGREVDDQLLSTGLLAWRNRCDLVVIEGAGGLYCPLSAHSTVFDLLQRLACPVVVVAGNRLGVISHTRMTVELLQRSGCDVVGVVLNDITPPDPSDTDLSRSSNARQLQTWLPALPLLQCSWNGTRLNLLQPESSAADWLRQTAEKAAQRWLEWTA